jgi:histidinol dehydrogenase
VLFTTNESIIEPIIAEVYKQLELLPRKAIATEALKSCRLFVVKNDEEMLAMVNDYAPEHLIIATNNAFEMGDQICNAGSVFLGHLTPESAGDYASGTNHTLPTNGYARIFSGVNLDSFVKKLTFQQISEYGLFNIGPAIENMASLEELYGHKNAVTLRLQSFVKK